MNNFVDDTLFKFVRCACCRSKARERKYPIDDIHPSNLSAIDIKPYSVGVAVCPSCSHEFIQPQPQPLFLKAYYSKYVSNSRFGFYKERSKQYIPKQFKAHYQPWLNLIEQMLGRKGRLLDIGAGLGMFLRFAHEKGFEVYGIEQNSKAVEIMQKYGIPAVNSPFEDIEIQEHFDVVTMWDLLEHLADPRFSLEKVSKFISQDSLLVLEIPARDSLLHNLAKFLYSASSGLIRKPLYLVCGLHHLHYFSKKGITNLLHETGFKVELIERRETEIMSLYKGKPGKRSFSDILYNIALVSIFFLARILKRQNKMIIFARKI